MSDLLVTDFDYDLPEDLIAQQPPAERGQSRMLVMDRATGAVRDSHFSEFPSLVNPGDLLVVNDSRVIPARLYARRTLRREKEKPTGRIEVMLTEPAGDNCWHALVRPGRKVAIGEILEFPSPADASRSGSIELKAEVLERGEYGDRLLRFEPVDDFHAALDRIGHIPLPPYIHRDDADADRERYQTVYSREKGSVAAPTAGLHFTEALLAALDRAGIARATLTLHVGAGTFLPVKVADTREHGMHSERGFIDAATAAGINAARAAGGRIVAVGTTSLRLLESAADEGGKIHPFAGETDLFITPGYRFRAVDLLLTNFHLPRSTLFMLVAAFAGLARMKHAYAHAIEARYRFFSYGDACLLFP